MDQRQYEILAGYRFAEKELIDLRKYLIGLKSSNDVQIEDLEKNYKNEYPQILKLKCINVGYQNIILELDNQIDELRRKAFAITRES